MNKAAGYFARKSSERPGKELNLEDVAEDRGGFVELLVGTVQIDRVRSSVRRMEISEDRVTGFRGPDPSVGEATQFKPGKSGNAGGRPKKKPISEAYQLLARSPMPPRMCKKMGLPTGSTWGEAVAVGQFRAASMDRNSAAAKEIRESIEGKVQGHVDLTVNAEEDIVLRLKRAHKRMQRLKAQREAQLTNGSHTIDVDAITSGS
jgi:hypothetical protein